MAVYRVDIARMELLSLLEESKAGMSVHHVLY